MLTDEINMVEIFSGRRMCGGGMVFYGQPVCAGRHPLTMGTGCYGNGQISLPSLPAAVKNHVLSAGVVCWLLSSYVNSPLTKWNLQSVMT